MPLRPRQAIKPAPAEPGVFILRMAGSGTAWTEAGPGTSGSNSSPDNAEGCDEGIVRRLDRPIDGKLTDTVRFTPNCS